MAIVDLVWWLDNYSGPDYVWYAKRLSGNDTLANESHQAGPYIPKEFLFRMFSALNKPDIKNPDVRFGLHIHSHDDQRTVRAIWYNNRFHGGTRNETRLTNFGGRGSALLDPENTGALALFVFLLGEDGNADGCNVWVCRNAAEEELVEDRVGAVEPGAWNVWTTNQQWLAGHPSEVTHVRESCWLEANEIPCKWLVNFPSGADIVRKTVELRPVRQYSPDDRLMKRRLCEYEIFRSVEEAFELPRIRQGFAGMDDFLAKAQSILQRRKARSGRSLELHTREIFIEEGMQENTHFSHQPESDPGKRPDFIFPSETFYKNRNFPTERLRLLAVKTTCKDRWRQVLNEAERIATKHLLTLQEGVSVNQFREMTDAGVKLVVPSPIIRQYHDSIQPHLLTLERFIGEVRAL
ncbi:MAG: type II restriction endonuclease [Desulfuromonadales bacterium]|nr:MAG: type II restriction endonuclease [Desulfuromonadales bacterium]